MPYEFAEDAAPPQQMEYTVCLPIDLHESARVELVFEPGGTVHRSIDGEVVGSWWAAEALR